MKDRRAVPKPLAMRGRPPGHEVPTLRLSIAANVIFLLLGIAFVVRRLLRSPEPNAQAMYEAERRSVLAALPPRRGATVFLGDSLTDRGEWSELFGLATIQNRGVAGETTRDVLARAEPIASQKPARVFLLAGVNDLAMGDAAPAIAERYGRILDVFREKAPEAQLYCQSVLPVRLPGAPPLVTNDRVRALNESLARVAAGRSCTFVDLYSALAGADGALDARYTLDGIHLTGEGYAAWARAIAPLLDARR